MNKTIHTLTVVVIVWDCQGEGQTGETKYVEGRTRRRVVSHADMYANFSRRTRENLDLPLIKILVGEE